MKIGACGACGNCMDFKCPNDAFKFVSVHGYTSAVIDQRKCNNCGKCLEEIDCLCEAIGG